MAKTVGILLADRVTAGLIVEHKLAGPLRYFPENPENDDALVEIPADGLIELLCKKVVAAAKGTKLDGVGVGVPGLIRSGVVEEAPNLPQLKGQNISETLGAALQKLGIDAPVTIVNDADAMAAGLAATSGQLDRLIRVWTLGRGIGYGRYPFSEGVWEGGHTIVSLDDKERFCGCGGRGHLEGIMGHRAMRLRFLDMEPEEIFAAAKAGDERCVAFKKLWHKSLAAATATSVHMAGPGKFYITGTGTAFLDIAMLKDYMQQMVKMSPLIGYSLVVIEEEAETAVIGAGVTAEQAAAGR